MVLVIHHCKCATCPGPWSPKAKKGEFVAGGRICICVCHKKKKKPRNKRKP